MTALEQTVLQTLNELDVTVRSAKASGAKVNLLPLFDRLDDLARQLPKGTDPELLHFLNRKSYEKARLLLQGREAEISRGACH
jgi:hypothetical protein